MACCPAAYSVATVDFYSPPHSKKQKVRASSSFSFPSASPSPTFFSYASFPFPPVSPSSSTPSPTTPSPSHFSPLLPYPALALPDPLRLYSEADAAVQCMHAQLHQLEGRLELCSSRQLQTLLQCHEQLTQGLPPPAAALALSLPPSVVPHFTFAFPVPSSLAHGRSPALSWSSLPVDLMPLVAQFLPSIVDLLRLSRLSRSFHGLLYHSDSVSRACWAHAPTVCLRLNRSGSLTLCESTDSSECSLPRDDEPQPTSVCIPLFTSAHSPTFSSPPRTERLQRIFHCLRHLPAVSLHVSLSVPDALPLLLSFLRQLPHLRQLAAAFTLTDDVEMPALEAIAGLASLQALDISRLSLVFPTPGSGPLALSPGRCMPALAPALRRLRHLTLWGDDLEHLTAQSVLLPHCASLTIAGHNPHYALEEGGSGRLHSLLRSFPALRYLALPSQWHLPSAHAVESRGWRQLQHLKYNLAQHWAVHSPPALPGLRSLHLELRCGVVDLEQPWVARQGQLSLEDEVTSTLALLAPTLTQLTLTAPCLTYSAVERTVDSSFKLNIRALNALQQLTLLFLDCAELISKKSLSHLLLPNDLLACRGSLRALGLVLKVNCVLRVLACFQPQDAFPALDKCHIRCHDDTAEHDGYRFDLGMKRERLEEHTYLDQLIRHKLGDTWATEEQLLEARVDAQWMKTEGLRCAREDAEHREGEEDEEAEDEVSAGEEERREGEERVEDAGL